MAEWIYNSLNWLYNHIENIICSWFTAALCYFLEIKGSVHVMLAIIAADLIVGIIASVWRRHERFSMSKFFIAVGRTFVFTAFVSFLYSMDKEMHQELAETYNIAAWIISGFYLWSFLDNADTIFGGWIIKSLKIFVKKEVENKTGFDITGKEASDGQL